MQTPRKQRVLVLGGNGFIGRYVVNRLRERGHEVTVGTRRVKHPETEIQLAFHGAQANQDLTARLDGYDAVVNTVGILRQRHKESYEQVHHVFVERLAEACAQTKCRLVHVSVLGLQNPVKSRFLLSKRRGELALKNTSADWAIVRPSIIDGEGGYGAKWFRRIAAWPIHIVPNNAKGMLCPIHVRDLASAICRVVEIAQLEQREFDLGGGDTLDVLEYLTLLKGRKPWLRVKVPGVCVRIFSHVFDLLHATPLSFGHYELLQRDNAPQMNALMNLINRAPRQLGRRAELINPVRTTQAKLYA